MLAYGQEVDLISFKHIGTIEDNRMVFPTLLSKSRMVTYFVVNILSVC